MGQLTFQATLGGAVNLAGPNTASTTTFTLPAADGTNGQALTTNGSGTLAFATVGASAATPTALGTVYGATSSASPNKTLLGYNAGVSTTGLNATAIGLNALYTNITGVSCTAVGYQALFNSTASSCTALGSNALYTNTAANNVAVGSAAGQNNTTGQICAIGSSVLNNNTTGTGNTAVGSTGTGYTAPLFTNVTGSYNSAFGEGTLANSTGSYNTALGAIALYSNTTASENTAVGYQALYSNTTADQNTAMGYGALYSNTTGTQNTCVGRNSGYGITTGSYNALFGVSARAGTTGEGNSAFGVYAALDSTTGYSNVSVGYEAGRTLTTGYENTLVGKGAGYPADGSKNITTGYRNTIVGQRAALSANSDFRSIVIGFEATGKGSQTGFIDPNGSVYQGNNSTLWAVTSDIRLKKNIVDNNIGLEKLTQIQVRNFEYRLPEEITEVPKDQAIKKIGVQLGVIAQELQQVLPECVKTESTGVMTVDADNLTWYMVNAIKELKAEIDQLKGNV